MSAFISRIRTWLEAGLKQGDITHVIIVCDLHEHDEFPIFVKKDEDIREQYDKYSRMSQHKVLEVYSLKKDIEMQLKESRAFHLD